MEARLEATAAALDTDQAALPAVLEDYLEVCWAADRASLATATATAATATATAERRATPTLVLHRPLRINQAASLVDHRAKAAILPPRLDSNMGKAREGMARITINKTSIQDHHSTSNRDMVPRPDLEDSLVMVDSPEGHLQIMGNKLATVDQLVMAPRAGHMVALRIMTTTNTTSTVANLPHKTSMEEEVSILLHNSSKAMEVRATAMAAAAHQRLAGRFWIVELPQNCDLVGGLLRIE